VFSSGAVKSLDSEDGRALTVNCQRLKPVVTNEIELSLIESIKLVDPVYHD